MRKFLLSAVLFLTVANIWVACKKDNNLTTPSFGTPVSQMETDHSLLNSLKVENGIIHFSEGDLAFDEMTALLTLSKSEFAAWSNEHGFNSLEKAIETATTEVSNANSEAEYRNALERNKNYLVLKIDEVNPRVEAGIFRRIANSQGIYRAGTSVFQVVDDRVVEARDGDISKLANAAQTFESNPASQVFVNPLFDNKQVIERDGGCGNCINAYCQTSDRKVHLSICVVNCYGCCGGVRKQIQPRVWGQKKNVWGNWTGYNTILSFEHVGYQIRDQFGTVQSFDNWNETTDPNEESEHIGYNWIDPQPCYSNCQSNQFLKVKGNGHSRGIGYGRWARICCGYLNGVGCPPTPIYSCN